MRLSLNYWIRAMFSAIYFWYSLDSPIFYCWSFLISMLSFFYFSMSLLIWSWLSSSWVMKVWNLAVELYLTNSTEIKWKGTEFLEFEDEGFSLSTDFERVFFEVGVFLEELAEFFGAFLENHGEFGDFGFDEVELWMSEEWLHYFSVILVRVALFLTSSA